MAPLLGAAITRGVILQCLIIANNGLPDTSSDNPFCLMIQREKRYVEVDVRFSTEGRLRPLQIIFDKGQVYKIDKIKDICRRAADVGGVGTAIPV